VIGLEKSHTYGPIARNSHSPQFQLSVREIIASIDSFEDISRIHCEFHIRLTDLSNKQLTFQNASKAGPTRKKTRKGATTPLLLAQATVDVNN
jgi:hypothetical protein